jgi:hypothetical protein
MERQFSLNRNRKKKKKTYPFLVASPFTMDCNLIIPTSYKYYCTTNNISVYNYIHTFFCLEKEKDLLKDIVKSKIANTHLYFI